MVYSLLFAASLIPRIINLGFDVINTDALFWKENTYNFLGLLFDGRFSDMVITHHPGVTLMWLGGVMTKFYRGAYFLINGVVAPDTNSVFLWTHFWHKLPIAVITSLFVLLVYWSLLKLFEDKRVALISALLVSLEPLFVAHSRVYQTDALLTSFMVGSVLMFLVFLKDEKRIHLVFSGILAGLALLTKSNTLFLIPFIPLILLIRLAVMNSGLRTIPSTSVKKYLSVLVIFYLVLAATFVAVWPSMWTNPKGTMSSYISGIFLEGEGRPNRHLFFGTETFDPGFWFYPAVFLFRTSPFTFIFSILGAVWFLRNIKSRKKEEKFIFITLLLFCFLYFLEISLPAKKLSRYMLPNFIISALLAGYSIVKMSEVVFAKRCCKVWYKLISYRAFLWFIPAFFLYFFVSYHPDELAYFSPLVGGFKNGQILTDAWWWGQGYKKAADYLNAKEGSEDIKTALYDFRSFKPFFNGLTLDAGDKEEFTKADYFVASIRDREGFELENTINISRVPYLGVFRRKGSY